ncbi:MAG: ammonia-forming cytochrome c nitrite reductase subunit c552 [Myxococcota bacterium]|jgi:hypothetical protein|nr:ammonia-forming cytochrome c nitrite reductase subunit c552 [Myxococcota bacterium]
MKIYSFSLLAILLVVGCKVGESGNTEILQNRSTQSVSFSHPQAECSECHEQHVQEWEISNHAYAAKDPVFHAMVRAGQAQTKGKVGQFCVQCHSPVGLATEQTPVFFDEDSGLFKQELEELDVVAQQGVSCDVCHSITDVIEPENARMVLTPDGTKRGTIKDPVATEAHQSSYSELHGKSEVCGSCHAVTTPRGALAEETFSEWAGSDAARQGKTCQSCHMSEYIGQAAPDSPERTLHRHTFVGVDVSLLAPEEFPGYESMRELVRAMLESSAKLDTRMVAVKESGKRQKRALEVTISNLTGHALPTGATAERQLWLEFIIENGAGDIVFESGTLDAHGDIRDGIASHSTMPGSDPQLAYYGQYLIEDQILKGLTEADEIDQRKKELDQACDAIVEGGGAAPAGVKVVTFPWQANWQCNRMIDPDTSSRHLFSLQELPAAKYSARLRLLFRTFPPYFLRELEEVGALDVAVKDRVPLVTVAQKKWKFEIDGDGFSQIRR